VEDLDELLTAFAQATGRPTVAEASRRALSSACEVGRAAWPGIEAPPADFARAIGAAVAEIDAPSAAIEALHCGDLWLATACGDGHPAAIEALDRMLSSVRPTLARMGAARELIDELLQRIRVRLLAADVDQPPRIRSYRGRGELRAWLKVVAVRDAVRALRGARDGHGTDDELETLMDPGGDPEVQAMQGAYRESFRAAFTHALAQLPPRDRNVLRYHLVESLSIDEIGALYRVHRATSARWLVRIREQLFVGTRDDLMRRLSASPSEVDSVIRLIRSRLDASIAGQLAPGGAPPP
jgi:RNA polymerase sigma-70 factor (ECF subfamily)